MVDNEIELVLLVISKINNYFSKKYKRDPYLYYTSGHCYYYAKILQEFFPNSKMYYNTKHIIIKIGDFFYDVQGIFPIYEHNDYIEIEDAMHEEYVKMILTPTNNQKALEIYDDILSMINKSNKLITKSRVR